MPFAIPVAAFTELAKAFEQLDKSPKDAELRAQCIERTQEICGALASGKQFQAMILKLLEAGNILRAAKLIEAFASAGVMTRRVKLSRMFG